MFSLRFILFPTWKKNVFFNSFSIHFTFYAIFKIKKQIEILKSAPSLTGSLGGGFSK